jgi:hypothetical protein
MQEVDVSAKDDKTAIKRAEKAQTLASGFAEILGKQMRSERRQQLAIFHHQFDFTHDLDVSTWITFHGNQIS